MQQDILDLVKQLSVDDTKTLSQKGLKAAEECGELAKAILPYDGATGTLHRVITKHKILEEGTDLMLCALSVIYSLGFTDDDIAAMMKDKALYWDSLQRDQKGKDKTPFEIHITVSTSGLIEQAFREDCRNLGIKSVVLNLNAQDGRIIEDVMTSQVVMGSTTDAFNAMSKTRKSLENLGYQVIREKIECTPWHPTVPKYPADMMKADSRNYFEAHLEAYIPENSKGTFQMLVNGEKAHLSFNVLKQTEDGLLTAMVTTRLYDVSLDVFTREVKRLRAAIIDYGFSLREKEHIEYCIYDTDVHQDSDWING